MYETYRIAGYYRLARRRRQQVGSGNSGGCTERQQGQAKREGRKAGSLSPAGGRIDPRQQGRSRRCWQPSLRQPTKYTIFN